MKKHERQMHSFTQRNFAHHATQEDRLVGNFSQYSCSFQTRERGETMMSDYDSLRVTVWWTAISIAPCVSWCCLSSTMISLHNSSARYEVAGKVEIWDRRFRKTVRSDYGLCHDCLPAWNNSAPTGLIFAKFEYFPKIFRGNSSFTKIEQ